MLEAGSPWRRPDPRMKPFQCFLFQDIQAVIGERMDSTTCSKFSGMPEARSTCQSQYLRNVG
eukprot:5129105-Amphidinium_carterae.1